MLIKIESPVKINQMVWVRNGQGIDYAKVVGFTADETEQRVKVEREGKERATWINIEDYNKEFSSDPAVILDVIQSESEMNKDVLDTLSGTPVADDKPQAEGFDV